MTETDKKLGEFGADIATLKDKVGDLDQDISRFNEQYHEGMSRIEQRLASIETRLSSKFKTDISRERLAWMLGVALVAGLFLENDTAMQLIKGLMK